MLPILPALLLLFLQGPANLERMALEGRLPAAMDGSHRIEIRDDRALAALLSASNNTELSSAILALINWSVDKPTSAPSEPISTNVVVPVAQVKATEDGFKSSQRSRDGPSVVV